MLRQVHAGMTGGHMGLKKTLAQLQRRAYWVGWRQQTARFCQRCSECATYFRGRLPHSSPMQEMVIGSPFERAGIDLTGPHPKSSRGYSYILTYIDHFSKWADAVPLRNKEAATVAEALATKIFPYIGLPRQLLSDNGGEFRNQLLDELAKRLDVDRIFTTAYTPSTNGTIERLHRTMNCMLGKVVSTNQRDWCVRLPTVMAAYRASVHSATGFSPNFLTFGRELNAPIDIVLGRPDDAEYHSPNDFIEHKLLLMESAYALTRDHLNASSARSKKHYDVRTRPKSLKVGDWVWFFSPRRYVGRSAKFQRNYSGPFLVIRQLGPVLFVVQKSSRSKEVIVHADKLKLCYGEHPPSWLRLEENVPSSAEVVRSPEITLRAEAEPFVPRSVVPESVSRSPDTPPSIIAPSTALPRPKRAAGRPVRYR